MEANCTDRRDNQQVGNFALDAGIPNVEIKQIE